MRTRNSPHPSLPSPAPSITTRPRSRGSSGAAARLAATLACAILADLRAADPLVNVITEAGAQVYAERHRATYRLGKNLVEEDVEALKAFLARADDGDQLRAPELRGLKNNVADALIAQNRVGPDLLEAFLALASDSGQDAAWREYLLQKIPDLALRLEDETSRKNATDFLRGQSENTEYILAGTALIALERLHRGDPSLIGPLEIAQRAERVLAHPQQANACKIAALQVLGAADGERGRRAARAALSDSQSPLMLKVSAIATLGAHGEPEDRPRVQAYENSPDYRLRTAARAALAKLDGAAP